MDKERIVKLLHANETLLKSFHVPSVSVFGSVLRGEVGPESDVDILVEFEPNADIGLFEFVQVKDALGSSLGMPLDLTTPEALHPAFKDKILREMLRVA
ncbi:MAG: nucleotidyltransferase family protein [Deltaproteobacteria bacterium]|nr:nucleotidyltransferase family protein [Deltaproteobacteria bacterium]